MDWTKTLLDWYEENRRDFPWRKSRNPYYIWLSEIILQQTRVQQGLPYYERFVEHFPTVYDLANAKEEEVLKLWQGLGYYSRARNLHASARWVVEERQGEFPSNFKDLLQLKGVGDYTASAIASICFEEAQAVVDGNVYRFLARFFGIEMPIDSSGAHKFFKAKATTLMKGASPNTFNQAMMEFGALQCTPKLTQCDRCPFIQTCVAFQQGKVSELPIKSKRVKITKRYFNYLVFKTPSGKTLVQKRKAKGIWQNLYEFPLIETTSVITKEALLQDSRFKLWEKHHFISCLPTHKKPVKHILSHQHLFIQFWQINTVNEIDEAIDYKSLKALPVPIVLEHFIDKNYLD
ncbi:MAG: A/G-specific adenine glycosylase [Flavobacteriaceae bacterium]